MNLDFPPRDSLLYQYFKACLIIWLVPFCWSVEVPLTVWQICRWFWCAIGNMPNTRMLPDNKTVKFINAMMKYLHYSPIMPGGGPIIPGGGPPTGMRGGPGCCGRIWGGADTCGPPRPPGVITCWEGPSTPRTGPWRPAIRSYTKVVCLRSLQEVLHL